jgi:hypothetical protein
MNDLVQNTCSNIQDIAGTIGVLYAGIVHLRALIPNAADNASKWIKAAQQVHDIIAGNWGHARNQK